jgi:hypothetical protein
VSSSRFEVQRLRRAALAEHKAAFALACALLPHCAQQLRDRVRPERPLQDRMPIVGPAAGTASDSQPRPPGSGARACKRIKSRNCRTPESPEFVTHRDTASVKRDAAVLGALQEHRRRPVASAMPACAKSSVCRHAKSMP